MKRRRSSLACLHQKSNEFEDKANNPQPEVQSLGPTITDLPFSITADILLRLPLKSVLICKCVCKTLRTLISDSQFAKLHFKRSPVALMIRTNDAKRVSRNLHLLDFAPRKFDPDRYCDYDSDDKDKYCCCDYSPMPDCRSHWLAEIKFKLPLRDVKMILGSVLNSGRRRKYIACKPRDDKFGVVNSCNGLICLCDPKYRNPVVVCNPVTGEFIRLPEGNKIENLKDPMYSGFGFYAKANKYVVVRFYCQYELYEGKEWRYVGKVAEMHTLGTSTWKSLVKAPYSSFNGWKCPTYLGGIYWLGFDERHIKIIFFHLETQKFRTVPSPPSGRYDDIYSSYRRDYICMGTLNGLLYICESASCRIRLWVKKHGVGSVWTKLFSINTEGCGEIFWPLGLYRPLKLFNRDRVLIMSVRNSLIYYDRKKIDVFRYLKVRGTPFRFDVFAHKPSLVSMKEAVVMGDNVQVQNVYSRCGKLNLREDNEVLFVAEDIAEFASRSSSPSGDEDDDSAEGFD